MDFSSNRRLRRATSEFNNLSIAPLTSKFPLDTEDEDEYIDAGNANSFQNSYIEGRSAPTTPRILSRNPSSSQLRLSNAQLPKSKSSSNLFQKGTYGSGDGNGNSNSSRRQHNRHNTHDSAEWMTRAGAAISSGTLESKGQTWLVSRASSTGLVQSNIANGSDDLLSGGYADDEYAQSSSRHGSRSASQAASRTGSRSASRRGSRSGSRPDLWMSGSMTPRKVRSNSSVIREQEDYFRQRLPEGGVIDMTTIISASPEERDDDGGVLVFSDDDSEFGDEILDSEVSAMVRQRGFGLGRWVDSLMEWSLFRVDEEDEAALEASSSGQKMRLKGKRIATFVEEGEEEEDENGTRTRHKKSVSVATTTSESYPVDVYDPLREGPLEEDALWQDATWFLSVLGKILL